MSAVPDMDVGVGIRRPIVKNELLAAFSRLSDALVQAELSPFLQACRFALAKIRLLREIGFRQINCLFKVQSFGHKSVVGGLLSVD